MLSHQSRLEAYEPEEEFGDTRMPEMEKATAVPMSNLPCVLPHGHSRRHPIIQG